MALKNAITYIIYRNVNYNYRHDNVINEFDLVSGTDINKHEIACSIKLSTTITYKINLRKGHEIE